MVQENVKCRVISREYMRSRQDFGSQSACMPEGRLTSRFELLLLALKVIAANHDINHRKHVILKAKKSLVVLNS
jgi:hypothetical protein